MWSSAVLINVDSALPLSRLNHAACTLSVYASQPGSPPDHATLDSGWWPALTGQDSHLLGSHRWFPVMSVRLHGVLHHQASPGATTIGYTLDSGQAAVLSTLHSGNSRKYSHQ